MTEIRRNRFRPVLVTIFWIWFLFNCEGVEIDPFESDLTSELFMLVLLSSMLLFKIKERILIEGEYLTFNLHGNFTSVKLSAIQNLYFNDCFNHINMETIDSVVSININQFDSKKVERFFTEHKLYRPETEEEMEGIVQE